MLNVLERNSEVKYIADVIYIFYGSQLIFPLINKPYKNDLTVVCLCCKGSISGHINLTHFFLSSSHLLILLPEQIIEYKEISKDFCGYFIIMSRKFFDKINLPTSIDAFLSVRSEPCFLLNERSEKALLNYYNMLHEVLNVEDKDFNRLAVINHLTIAFFYGLGFFIHKLKSDVHKTRNEIIVDDFLRLVQHNFKRERSIAFYADRMCVSIKYLSRVVSQCSGKTAGKWIDDFIILEAKMMLQSTNFTALQISEELNFPSQSFFGKYFKRAIGLSPLEYRRKCK